MDEHVASQTGQMKYLNGVGDLVDECVMNAPFDVYGIVHIAIVIVVAKVGEEGTMGVGKMTTLSSSLVRCLPGGAYTAEGGSYYVIMSG